LAPGGQPFGVPPGGRRGEGSQEALGPVGDLDRRRQTTLHRLGARVRPQQVPRPHAAPRAHFAARERGVGWGKKKQNQKIINLCFAVGSLFAGEKKT